MEQTGANHVTKYAVHTKPLQAGFPLRIRLIDFIFDQDMSDNRVLPDNFDVQTKANITS